MMLILLSRVVIISTHSGTSMVKVVIKILSSEMWSYPQWCDLDFQHSPSNLIIWSSKTSHVLSWVIFQHRGWSCFHEIACQHLLQKTGYWCDDSLLVLLADIFDFDVNVLCLFVTQNSSPSLCISHWPLFRFLLAWAGELLVWPGELQGLKGAD